MQDFTYYAPTEIVFGKGVEEEAGRLCAKYGASRVFIVYGGGSVVKSGLLSRVEANIKAAGLEVMFMGGVQPNPLLSKSIELANAAREFKADFILAVGGGSVIDCSKAVAIGAVNPDVELWDFWMLKKPLTKALRTGAVLTLSAAGSETSEVTVISDDVHETPIKRGLNSPLNRCAFAIMNPELTMTLPKYQIGAGVTDIFMHTMERWFTKYTGNHLSDEFAGGLFRTIVKYGKRMYENPNDYEAASEVMWCGSISHVGITGLGSKGGDWGVHQFGQAISAMFDLTHGATLSATFGTWARYVMDAAPERFAEFANVIYGVPMDDTQFAANEGIRLTEEFFKSLGMPISIEELMGRHFTKEEVEALAYSCSFEKTRTVGMIKVIDYNDMMNIFSA